MTNVRDYGAIGDDTTDDTQAFLDAIAAQRSKRAYLPRSDGSLLSIAAGGVIDVPAGVYRLSQDIKLQQREHLRCEDGSFLSFSGQHGLIFESFGTQSQSEIEVTDLTAYSVDGGVGLWAQGSGFCVLHGETTIGGFDVCVRLTNANGFKSEGPMVLSSWNNMGNPHPIGIWFDGSGAGGCNGNTLRGVQCNACEIGVLSVDGQGNEVHGNFNSCGVVAQIEGAQSLKIGGEAEGCTGPAYFRIGKPGGYMAGRICAQNLDLSAFSASRNELHAPAFVQFEYCAQVWTLRCDNVRSLGAPQGSPMFHAAPGPLNIPHLMIRDLYRSGMTIAGSPAPAAVPPGQPLHPALGDRPMGYGIDHGA